MGTTLNLPPKQAPPTPPASPFRNENSGQSLIAIVIGLVTYSTAFGVVWFNTKNSGEKWWLVVLVAIACHIYISIQQVQPNEWGALLFLGRALKQLNDGPVFTFWPLFKVTKEVRTIFQVVVGTPLTDKEGRSIADEYEDPIDGVTILKEREPFRVSFLSIEALFAQKDQSSQTDSLPSYLALPVVTEDLVKKLKGDPLHSALTCDPQLVFWFDIESYLDYLRVVHDVKTLSRNIASVAKATLQECAGRITIGTLIANIDLVCQRLTYRVEQLIGEPYAQVGLRKPNLYWGVNFRGVQIYSSGLPRTVNVSMSSNTAAGYTKQQTITTSEGEKQRLINVGTANAEAERLLLEARAAGTKALAEATGTPEGQLILKLQAMERALSGSRNVTILPADMSILTEAVSAVRAIDASRSRGPSTSPKS